MSLIYLLTEGVHDVAFLGKFLVAALNFERVLDEQDLDRAWVRLLPTKWPVNGSLRPSVPAPSFYRHIQSGTSVTIVNAEGIDRLAKRLETHQIALATDGVTLDAVGVVLDADSTETPEKRFKRMADALEKSKFTRPQVLDRVAGTPRTGVFILPGGGTVGTLEDLLLECAAASYPHLLSLSKTFVDGIDQTTPEFLMKEFRDFRKPAGRSKVVVGAMGAVLKPSRAIQTTLEDHDWVSPGTWVLPRMSVLLTFLSQLTGVPTVAAPPPVAP